MFQEDGSLQKFLDDNNKATADWRNEMIYDGFEKNALAIPDDAFEVELPGMFLESEGNGYSGSMWLYKKVYLDFDPDEDSFLYVGELQDSDKTYINGEFVGNTEYCYPPRKYPFSGSILKKGENLIAVRLLVDNKNGGFLKDHQYYLRSGDKKISIEGTWYKKLEVAAKRELWEETGLDLIEINSSAKPPILKICRYDKMLYELKKNAKKNKDILKVYQDYLEKPNGELAHKILHTKHKFIEKD